MEKYIVIAIVAAAVFWLFRMFKKQSEGKGGCSCNQNCKSCDQMKDDENS